MTTFTGAGYSIFIPSWTTSTNLGPLPTTTFPSECLQSFWNFNTPGLGMPWTYLTQGCAASTCCPSGNVYTEPWAWMTSYYSPGVCPYQYHSCPGPPPPTALSSAPGETIAFCCPTNYNCPSTANGFFQFCASALSTPVSVTVVDNIFDQKTLSTSSWTLQSEMAYSWQVVYPIQVRTRASDATATVTTSASATSITATNGETTGISGGGSSLPPSTPTSTTSNTQSGSGLSTADIVGVVITATCSVLGLIFTIAFKIWKQKKQQKQQGEESLQEATRT